jgi:hypothetical protein
MLTLTAKTGLKALKVCSDIRFRTYTHYFQLGPSVAIQPFLVQVAGELFVIRMMKSL